MAIVPYLAMTAAEMRAAPSLPRKCAWMACHFSPYSTGLTNLPPSLPPESLLILNDRTPIHGHDPERIREELEEALTANHCAGLLLDFQRPNEKETAALTAYLAEHMTQPIIISTLYALPKVPVFLPPIPLHSTVTDYLHPWADYPIWIDISNQGSAIILSSSGTTFADASPSASPHSHSESNLFIHYSIHETAEQVIFHLYRTDDDINALLTAFDACGILGAVGLYQEFQRKIYDLSPHE